MFVGSFFAFRNFVEKLCVSWALSFNKRVRVWACKIRKPHTHAVSYTHLDVYKRQKHLRADFVYAWPTAEIAVMGADGAADILYGKQMKNMNPAEKAAFRSEKIDEYNEKFMNPSMASMHGYVDEIIKPEATRERVYADILMLADKRSIDVIHKKHGNIPL